MMMQFPRSLRSLRMVVSLFAPLLVICAPRAAAQGGPGSLDTGFNASADGGVDELSLQPDGKVLVGGQFTTVNGVARNYIARLNADGSVDTGFNASTNAQVFALPVQPDGKVLVGGNFTTVNGVARNKIARLNTDGSLDSGFNASTNGAVYALSLQPDGKVLVGGNFTTVNGVARNSIARLNADGSLDSGFTASVSGSAIALALQPDGRVLVGGEFATVNDVVRNRIARLNADGSLDAGFSASADNWVYALSLQPDGKLLVGGLFSAVNDASRRVIARLNADGSLDSGFTASVIGTGGGAALALALQPNGKVLIGGQFTTVSGVSRSNIARLNADGSLDSGFTASVTGNPVWELSLQPDGKVLVGGIFTTVNGVARNRIARLVGDPYGGDCNGNGINDATDIANHTASDCNGNGTLDSCDIASGLEVDLDSDGFPDACQQCTQDLGTLGGTNSYASGVSTNGSVVVGWADRGPGNRGAFRWTAAGGMQDLGGTNTEAKAVSPDGSVVVGGSAHAFRWTASGGMQDLGTLGGPYSMAYGMTSGGNVVVGSALLPNGQERAFYWTASGGMQNLGTLGGTQSKATAAGLNGVDVVVVGSSLLASGQQRAFRWTAIGQQDLGTLGGDSSEAIGVSADGSVVVGSSLIDDGSRHAFRWTAAGGMQDLGTLGGNDSEALCVRADGAMVLGKARLANGVFRAFRWTAVDGMQVIPDIESPTGVSADGSVVVGPNFSAPFHAARLAPENCPLLPTSTLVSSTPTTCGASNGSIDVTVANAPILSWTGPSGFASTAEDLTNLAAGTYTLTARGPGGTSTLTVAVAATPDTTAPVITSYTSSASAAASQNCSATVPNFTSSVVATDNCTIASITQTPLAGASVGLGATTVTITVTDAAGNFTTRTATFTVTGSPATYYADADRDGYGYGASTVSCASIAGSVTNNTDCNDTNAAVHPGATEVCNGIDDDCVGGADNGLTFSSYYADTDHDGYGAIGASAQSACAQPSGSAPNNTDCNDSNAGVHPNAVEVCNDGLDNNCVWGVDEGCAPFTVFMTGPASPPVPGDPFIVRVSCNAAGSVLTGEQLAVHFDAARLALVDVVPVAGSPFTLEIAKQIDNTAGTLRYAAGIPGGGQGLSQAAGLVDLVFTVRAGASMCGDAVLATFGPVGGFGTRFSRPGASAVVPALSNLASMHLDTTAPVLSGLPTNADVPTDAGSTYGAFVSLPTVTATDDCDGAVAVVATGIPANGVFPIGSTTVTWTAVDAAGNTVSASRTVTVEPYQLLDLTVCVDGAFTGNSTRQIRVTVGAASSVVSVPFTQTCGSVSAYHVPVSASLACVTAKDTAHSISGHAAASIVGTRYSASVLLKQGDSNDDDMVDIVDFGLFVDDFGGPRAREARSNFNADLAVNNGDFSFISVNFFQVGESCTGALAGAHPRDRVSVKQLRREGLGRLESADINRDGWVDAVDVQMFMQGRRSGGAPQRADVPRESGGVAW